LRRWPPIACKRALPSSRSWPASTPTWSPSTLAAPMKRVSMGADFSRINPAYFDMADVRIQHLADHGLAACVVGFWGYFIPRMGMAKVKQHWRYLIARWGAYPVCLVPRRRRHHALLPFQNQGAGCRDTKARPDRIGALCARDRSPSSSHHHSSFQQRATLRGRSRVLDFDMLQTGHNDRQSVPNTIETVNHSLAATAQNAGADWRGLLRRHQEASRQEVQRFMFWSALLSGTGGHTYGANGIWQVNTRQQPYGLSPHGHSWGGPRGTSPRNCPAPANSAWPRVCSLAIPGGNLNPGRRSHRTALEQRTTGNPSPVKFPVKLIIAFSVRVQASHLQESGSGKSYKVLLQSQRRN
jgi:hypothetical protein